MLERRLKYQSPDIGLLFGRVRSVKLSHTCNLEGKHFADSLNEVFSSLENMVSRQLEVALAHRTFMNSGWQGLSTGRGFVMYKHEVKFEYAVK